MAGEMVWRNLNTKQHKRQTTGSNHSISHRQHAVTVHITTAAPFPASIRLFFDFLHEAVKYGSWFSSASADTVEPIFHSGERQLS